MGIKTFNFFVALVYNVFDYFNILKNRIMDNETKKYYDATEEIIDSLLENPSKEREGKD